MTAIRLCVLVPLVIIVGGCTSDEKVDCPVRGVGMKSPSVNEPSYCQHFSSTLTVKDRMGQPVSQFVAGEPISFESTVTNNSSNAVTVSKSSGCPQVRFEVYSTAGMPNIVWTSEDGLSCTQALEAVTFAPGETRTFSAEWNQALCDGSQAPVGEYRIRTQDSTECWAHIDGEAPVTLQ